MLYASTIYGYRPETVSNGWAATAKASTVSAYLAAGGYASGGEMATRSKWD